MSVHGAQKDATMKVFIIIIMKEVQSEDGWLHLRRSTVQPNHPPGL